MKGFSAVPAFVTAALTSAAVWAVSPWLTGRHEPWDADSPFYVCGLIIAGAVAGVLTPKPIWALYLGAVIGQVAYQALFLRLGPLFPLGVLFLAGYCFVFIAAAAFVGWIRTRLHRV